MNRIELLTASVLGLAAAPVLAATGTVTFQNGANGYAGMVHETISSDAPDTAGTINTTITLDGYKPNTAAAGATSNASPDTQGLLRFDDIFGSAASQIPAGATVLSASLRLTTQSTATSASAVTGGPYGVAGLLQAFNPATTTYNSFAKNFADPFGNGGSVGPSYTTGTATRPMGGIGPQTVSVGNVSVNVTPIVRNWASGQTPNYGFAVQSGINGTDDGWIIRSGTHGTQSSHPVLSVTYTTDPTSVTRLQQGVNGYTGTTMALVQQAEGVDLSSDGQYVSQTILDASKDATTGVYTTNPAAVLRFDNIAGNKPTADATLLSATLSLTTGDTSGNARSPGTWQLEALGSAFTVDKPFSEYGPNGPGGNLISSIGGMTSGSVAQFDVTSYVQSVLAGGDNFGWAVKSANTTDGWQLNFTGTEDPTARPELTLVWSTAGSVPEPTTLAGIALAGAALLRRRR